MVVGVVAMASTHRADQHANGGKEHAAKHSTQGLNGSLGSLHTWEARDLGGNARRENSNVFAGTPQPTPHCLPLGQLQRRPFPVTSPWCQ